jgi:hypothetical protein
MGLPVLMLGTHQPAGMAGMAGMAGKLRGGEGRGSGRGAARGHGDSLETGGKVAVWVIAPPSVCRYTPQTRQSNGRAGVRVGFFENRDRRAVAVVVTTDGRRVTVPTPDLQLGVSPLDLLRSLLLGLEGLLGLLITGSRRENGGTRRIGRN